MNKILMALAGILLIIACNKESHLTDPAARLRSSIQDSIPGDSIPIDSSGHDTIPHYPTDSTFSQIKGLVITPSSIGGDTLDVIKFHIETTTNYPVANSRVEAYFTGTSFDSLNVIVFGIQPVFPYTPGNAPAKKDISKFWTPGVNVPLSVNLKGTVYRGSISTAGLNYTISWAHDSIILITPKTFPR